ncbi:MAG TPA: fructosamine kinase family protein, partial [Wenzhouxiangella sp.]|nr:fructosamine kinase family protein [Wenzhouxiangella sp.]
DGFDESFYRAYEEVWPLPAGFETRRLFYKLYHMLNHANMFGGPYVQAAEQLCQRILRP